MGANTPVVTRSALLVLLRVVIFECVVPITFVEYRKAEEQL